MWHLTVACSLFVPISFSKLTQLKTHYSVFMGEMEPPFCSVKVEKRNHNGYRTLSISSFPWEVTEPEAESVSLDLSTRIVCVCVWCMCVWCMCACVCMWYMCACMCVCVVHVCICVYMRSACTHVCMEASNNSPPYFLRQVLSLYLRLTNSTRMSPSSKDPPVRMSPILGLYVHTIMSGFLHEC